MIKKFTIKIILIKKENIVENLNQKNNTSINREEYYEEYKDS